MTHTCSTGIALCLLAQLSFAAPGIGDRLTTRLRSDASSTSHRVWVTFSDKGAGNLHKGVDPLMLVSQRSLARRQNVLPADALIDETDLPVEERYVEAIRQTGAVLRHRSRWFNAVSVTASADQIAAMSRLPFVREIELVGTYGRQRPEPSIGAELALPGPMSKTDGTHALDYGSSAAQLALMKVPQVHDLGNHAEGVIVGVFDDGFRLPEHEAFAAMHILATHDFVDHKTSVVPNYSPAGGHGVNTLSTLGGYKPGSLIGPAFGASFILARTENDSLGVETPVEEDNWVAAIEWAESLGVQVTSTSLGYIDYDAPYPSWTWQDMNGRTTTITRAAAMAVRKGVVVLNSAGNEGYSATHNTLGAPADGDSVVAVGAVTPAGVRAGFSSVGPTTADPPRIKPDVMAQGTSVYVASSTSPTGYGYSQGTSFACPLAAGVAALLVKAAPNASPMAVVNAMKLTASNAATPNNEIGWGIVNAKAALDYLTTGDTSVSPDLPPAYALRQNYPNPFNPATTIAFDIPGKDAARTRLAVYDVLGRELAVLVNETLPPGRHTRLFTANGLASGVYFYRVEIAGGGREYSESKTMLLLR